MNRDLTFTDNIKHINAMIHLIESSTEESRANYCKLLAVPQLKEMGYEVLDSSVKTVLYTLYKLKAKYTPFMRTSFRNGKTSDIETMNVHVPTPKWGKDKKLYSYTIDNTLKGTVEVLSANNEKRYKWSTDKGVGYEKYLYKAQKIVERTV